MYRNKTIYTHNINNFINDNMDEKTRVKLLRSLRINKSQLTEVMKMHDNTYMLTDSSRKMGIPISESFAKVIKEGGVEWKK